MRLGNTQVANPFFKVFVFAGINVRGKIGAVGTQFMGNHFDIEFGLKVAFFFFPFTNNIFQHENRISDDWLFLHNFFHHWGYNRKLKCIINKPYSIIRIKDIEE
ncbi:hypothetical protein SDC9_80142 [bioreactor metagenome]|uniref:Uncharacterized protein n=1 Tax=bioreactor metagenome TaxID=1076179 RepID=A0A644YY74_9ZZZZ